MIVLIMFEFPRPNAQITRLHIEDGDDLRVILLHDEERYNVNRFDYGK